MTPTIKKHINLAFKSLILAGYFLLFLTQVNYRFYSIANFYVYGSSSVRVVDHSTPVIPFRHTGRRVVYGKAMQKFSHLSLDKRFQSSEAVRIAFIRPSFDPPVALVKRDLFVAQEIDIPSSDLPVNGLRGPPCV